MSVRALAPEISPKPDAPPLPVRVMASGAAVVAADVARGLKLRLAVLPTLAALLARLRAHWSRTSVVTRVTLWYTLLLASVLVVVGVVVAGTLTRWIEADTLSQLSMQAQEVRVALAAVAQTGEPFPTSAQRVLNSVLGRDVQASLWAADGRLIARSEGFFFPDEKLPPPPPGGSLKMIASVLPAKPAIASSDNIRQLSDRLYVNVNMVRDTMVSGVSGNHVATLVLPLDGVSEDLVATSDAYPDLPPLDLRLPKVEAVQSRKAVLALSTSLTREVAAQTNVLTVVAVAGVLALVLGAFIARRIVRHSLRPIDALAAASQRMAAGDLATRVSVPPGDNEIGRLAHSFNEMAVQLDSAFTAQRAFVADASHELRTPLAALRGQVDVMRRALPEQPADADKLASSMRRELARLSRLVDDLLVLARLDALGAGALSPHSVDVCSVAQDVCAQVRALPAAKDRQIQLEARGPVRITADGERLHQVLLNLLANAVEHTPPGGNASISVAASEVGAEVVVRDSGPGILASHLPNIFDRFYRADGIRQRGNTGGAGLGLSIAQAIIEAHGGAIRVANRPQGGAEFTVEIPSQT